MVKTDTGMGKTNTEILEEGGPAFPHYEHDTVPAGWEGMTLRDYFAGQAITGTLPGALVPDSDVAHYARLAYRMADAMVKERNQR